MTVQTEMI